MTNPALPEPILDPGIIADLRRLRAARMDDLFQSLLTSLQAEVPSLLAAARAGLAAGDAAALRYAAHSLKGAACSLGALRLAALAGQLEALGRAGTVEGAESILDLLEPEVSPVYAALLAEHQRQP